MRNTAQCLMSRVKCAAKCRPWPALLRRLCIIELTTLLAARMKRKTHDHQLAHVSYNLVRPEGRRRVCRGSWRQPGSSS